MATDVDLAVVGAGLMGAATAWWAARQGASVLVLEQFEAHHARGSSHGSARIVRRAYEDALYTRLTGQAFELWREIELANDTPLLRLLGGLDFGPRRNVPVIARHLADAGVPHEVLDAAAAARRWPGMRFSGQVVFHEQAGTLDAERAVDTMLDDAIRHGARVQFGTPVHSVDVRGDERVELRIAGDADRDHDVDRMVSARRVVLAPGGWLEPLVDGRVRLPRLTVTQQPVFHFRRLDPAAPPWPSVIHEDAEPVYHLAGGRDGGAGDDRKIGHHTGGTETTARDRDGIVGAAARARMVAYVTQWLPGLDPTPRSETTCTYTTTPSEDFVLDRVGPLVICSACSGHGAKFAPVIGGLAGGLALGAGPEPPARFRLDAHALDGVRGVSL